MRFFLRFSVVFLHFCSFLILMVIICSTHFCLFLLLTTIYFAWLQLMVIPFVPLPFISLARCLASFLWLSSTIYFAFLQLIVSPSFAISFNSLSKYLSNILCLAVMRILTICPPIINPNKAFSAFLIFQFYTLKIIMVRRRFFAYTRCLFLFSCLIHLLSVCR